MNVIRETRSVCPVCLRPIGARLTEAGGVVYMEKSCPEHGSFSVPVWHGALDMDGWRGGVPPLENGEGTRCPGGCPDCSEHGSATCCALLEVTKRCNLRCRFCFANGGDSADEPTLAELKNAVSEIIRLGNSPLIQLSGGEPTVRDDLPELVSFARASGCKYVQLNSNGLRLAHDPDYVRRLAEAGLSFVFMQFDGVSDGVYETLRGRPLLEIKKRAVKNCGDVGLGVTLVPTVVRGVNDGELGDIVRLGASLSPTVRGVHFQPVSYFGRYPDAAEDRYTLDELVRDLCRQTGLDTESLLPSRCDHPMCGFHGSFYSVGGRLTPVSKAKTRESGRSTAEQNREYIARRWLIDEAAREPEKPCCCEEIHEASLCCGGEAQPEPEPCCGGEAQPIPALDDFLRRVKRNGFTLTAMAFQDAMNLDIERLRLCSLHVYKNGGLVPFCAAYLSAMEARA